MGEVKALYANKVTRQRLVFPAPVCNECCVPTMLRSRVGLTAETETPIGFVCLNCGATTPLTDQAPRPI
jgi:hypothetical protein